MGEARRKKRQEQFGPKPPSLVLIANIKEQHEAALWTCRPPRLSRHHLRRTSDQGQRASKSLGRTDMGTWLQANCPFIAPRTERLYRRLADPKNQEKLQEKLGDWQRVASLSIRSATALLRDDTPADADEEDDTEKPTGEPQPSDAANFKGLPPGPILTSEAVSEPYNPSPEVPSSLPDAITDTIRLPVILAAAEPDYLVNILIGTCPTSTHSLIC